MLSAFLATDSMEPGDHRGWSTVSGRAGERLDWTFGSGERFVTLGADKATRVR